MDNYAILETSYVKSYNRKVADNGFIHNLVNFENFGMCGLKSTKKRRVSAAFMNGSLNGRFLYIGFVFVRRIACDQVIAL